VERLAEHAFRGRLRDKALKYLRLAGSKAARREAYREAATLYEQALRVLGELGETTETLQLGVDIRFDLRNALQPMGDRERIANHLRDAEALAERLKDARRAGWVQSHLAEQYWMLGRTEEASIAGARALRIADELSDLPLRVVTNLPLGLVHHTRGEYRRAMQYFGWNVAHLKAALAEERFGMFVLPSSFSAMFVAWSLAEEGDFRRASRMADRATRIAGKGDHPHTRGYAYFGTGVVALRRGKLAAAIRAFELALGVRVFGESPVGFAFVASHLGYALSLARHTDAGITLLERTVSVAEERRFVARHSLRLAYLAEAYLLSDRLAEAENLAARAVALAIEHHEYANQAYALRVAGEVKARLDMPLEAERDFSGALEIAQALEMRPLIAHCHRGLGQALAVRREHISAVRYAASAASAVDELGMRFWDEAWRLESALADDSGAGREERAAR
jgi:tetratricopeptide (TPR) repeat protein